MIPYPPRSALFACAIVLITVRTSDARAQTAPAEATSSIAAPRVVARSPTWSDALFIEFTANFVPYANDIPLTIGIGVRVADRHEFFGRIGYMSTGDDARSGVGVLGYRVAFRPHRLVRPVIGAMIARLPTTCGHDAMGTPICAHVPLFIFAATGGVRVEPVPWLGLAATLSLGLDSFPYPFGMVEVAASFALPLS